MPENASAQFQELVQIMARLRGKNGCPWDRKQTHESIKPYLVEETYEVLEAIDEGDPSKLREELGDLALQIVFHAQMAEETGCFTIADVLRAINEKLVRRHPHVFGDVKADTAQEVLFNWEQIKKQEREQTLGRASALDGVPRELPALLRAHRLQEKASRVGFDWKEAHEVFQKVDEEISELRAAIAGKEPDRIEAELGDLLFSLVNLSRFIAVNPEEALRKTIARFIARFQYIEEELARRGKNPGAVQLLGGARRFPDETPKRFAAKILELGASSPSAVARSSLAAVGTMRSVRGAGDASGGVKCSGKTKDLWRSSWNQNGDARFASCWPTTTPF